jgi:hypothetical protein
MEYVVVPFGLLHSHHPPLVAITQPFCFFMAASGLWRVVGSGPGSRGPLPDAFGWQAPVEDVEACAEDEAGFEVQELVGERQWRCSQVRRHCCSSWLRSCQLS